MEFPDVIEDGVNGFLAAGNKLDDYQNTFFRAMDLSEDGKEKMKLQAMSYVRVNHDAETQMNIMCQEILSLAGSRVE